MIERMQVVSGTRMRASLVKLCESQNWRCGYCGVRFVLSPRGHEHAPSFDEVVARSQGGSADYHNQIAACIGCNTAKQSMDAEEFYELVRLGIGIGQLLAERAALAASLPNGLIVGDRMRAHRPAMRRASYSAKEAAKIGKLREIATFVSMTEKRREYFLLTCGFVPGEELKPIPVWPWLELYPMV